ncbi:MAG: radical SAM family heme chaperone HemW [Ruminococcus sp.]|nr:radical SAM family heme chaperone HemW [Candidatus Apopatosoma intestinale]
MAMTDHTLGLYVHIPFCVRKCAYCDFYSMGYREETARAYVDALIAQIRANAGYGRDRTVDTVYFGGGTPSILATGEIGRILAALRASFSVSPDAEITVEANPGTVDRAKLDSFRASGVNRLSIGMQSASDEELRTLSRIHTRDDFRHAFFLSREAGFDNISVDIMYGLPHQTEKRLSDTVDYALSLHPEHISLYGLKIEAETPFGRDPGIVALLPDEDTQADMYLKTAEKLEKAGFFQYEISNFAQKGRESRHNLRYWQSRDYLGFGPAAYSCVDGHMFSYPRDLARFLASAGDGPLGEDAEVLTENERATQFVMLAFRTAYGVDADEYRRRFGRDFPTEYGDRMKPFLESGFLRVENGHFFLSREGMLVSNSILSEILDFTP